MRRRWPGAVGLVVLVVALVWWWSSGETPAVDPAMPASASANEGAFPAALKPSVWNAPIERHGALQLTGVVSREGEPVPGVTVTAVAAHGEEVLSDLPCKCDNHCGQMLLSCGCAEASGQLVELVAARTGESAPLARATTDAKGAFTLTGLEPGTLTLFADAPDGVGWLGNVASDAQDTKLELSAGRFIKGKVITSDDKPAKGALVTAIFAAHSRFFDAVADDQGEFRLGPLPQGTYAVVGMQGGLLPDHQQARDDDSSALTLELSVPRALTGVVLADGAPVPGATVKLEGMHRKRTVNADAKGEFHLERLRPGDYELSAESPKGMGFVESVISKHEDRTGVTIALAHGEPLTGRVVTEAGAPAGEVRVSLLSGDKWRTVDSAPDGTFRFEGVDAEEHELFAKKKGLLEARGKGRGGQSGIELRMMNASVLSGEVRASTGELVLKYTISATALDAGNDGERESSTDGGFSLDLSPREYELRVEAPPLAPSSLRAWAPASGVVLVMKPGAKIRGRVLDFDGEPAADARVIGTRALGGMTKAKTDAAGHFELNGLEAGDWSVSATMRQEYFTVWRATGEVSLTEGGSAEMVLRPKRGVRFAGVVIDAEGAPLAGVQVMGWQTATDGGYEPDGTGSAVTDAQGHFSLQSLHAGPVQVMARTKESGSEAYVTAVAPDENVVVKLKSGTTISGRVVNGEGRPITAFKVMQQPFDDAEGKFTMPLREGTPVVAFDAEGYAQLMKAVKLKVGDNPLGEVVLQRGRPVSGVVRDARTHQPIAGALVDVGLGENPEGFSLSEELGAARADAQGRFKLNAVDSSSTHIYSSAPSYVSRMQPLSGNTVDFELQPATALNVKVLDAAGAPLARAWVVARAEAGALVPFKRGGSEGSYQATLPPGAWQISVQTADARTFRSVELTLGETAKELVIREATDGVTVEVKISEPAEAMLVQGSVPLPRTPKDFIAHGAPLRLVNGVAQHVLPGAWTVMLFRTGSLEAAVQPIEVKAGANPVFTITPQWQQLDPAAFGR